jgi:hypothetical protein
MNYELVQCGACPGCQRAAAVTKLCAEIDALFLPKREILRRDIAETYERERRYGDHDGESWRERAAEMTEPVRRSLAALTEEHQRCLDAAMRPAALIGCTNFVIRIGGASP